ncbi:MAG: nitrite/Sulfite reductase ferredoxin-like half domain protein [Marmoricola sp.]|nr:nitrite/Sulfite reductase ferredoxin-like half domain protein [Marmoricola sp.]
MQGSPAAERTRRDLCPGVLRPWPADDGALVRIRLVGGRVAPAQLTGLAEVARAYGDGRLHLTGRANLQLRSLPSTGEGLPADVVSAIEGTGLLPSRTHELVRNIMMSPLSGISGGRADLREVADDLDRRLCADPTLSSLPGRFLFVLDDGRGDLGGRTTDLGAVALDATTAQVRLGSHTWGAVVDVRDLAGHLVDLAREFVRARGDGPSAPWHVDELGSPLASPAPADPRTDVTAPATPFGPVGGAEHVPVPDGVLDQHLVGHLVERAAGRDLVVTPWHGVLVAGGDR